MAYENSKDLTRGLTSDKILRDKVLMDIKKVLLLWFIISLIKKLLVVVLKLEYVRQKNDTNQLLENSRK